MNAPLARPAAASTHRAWTRALELIARATRDPSRTLPRAVAEWARTLRRPAGAGRRRGDPTASCGSRRASTNMRAGRSRRRSPKGATVALMMRNRPEYAAIWLGLTRIGAVVALIRARVCAAPRWRTRSRVAGAQSRRSLAGRRGGAARGGICGADLDASARASGGSIARSTSTPARGFDERRCAGGQARRSGVAHLHVRHHRLSQGGRGQSSQDHHLDALVLRAGGPRQARIAYYNCLPMHHSVGGVVAIGAPLVGGGAVVDCAEVLGQPLLGRRRALGMHRVPVYRRALPLSRRGADAYSQRSARSLRLALGNGLAAPVWAEFAERFPQIRVLEFYASTEGNVWLYNVEGRQSARSAACRRS